LKSQGLYAGEFRDNCGFGMMVQIDNKPSHGLLRKAIDSLVAMTHRGGVNADGKTGDGCGLLMQLPRDFFRDLVREESGVELGEQYALAMVFLPQDVSAHAPLYGAIETRLAEHDLRLIHRRETPVNPEVLGELAAANRPHIVQLFVEPLESIDRETLNLKCFLAGRHIEQDGLNLGHEDFYLASFSSSVVAYKGLMQPYDLAAFYPDLHDERLCTAICLFHQRFSTNTLPQWHLAQPFHMLAHNGEINTIVGNRNNVKARLPKLSNERLGDLKRFKPLLRLNYSDSASLDQVLELLVSGGMHILRAIRMLVPPAWENVDNMDPRHQALHHFNALHMEPWDGPAGLVVTDGRYAICLLDRNGLRPARWQLTSDRVMTLASEIGVNPPHSEDEVLEKGRIGPGRILAIDVQEGCILDTKAIDDRLAAEHPYLEWLHDNLLELESISQSNDNKAALAGQQLQHASGIYYKTFGVTLEELDACLREMLEKKQEPTGSMGDDTPLAVLSTRPRLVTDYLRQMFAQVTNPPIDPLREQIVMSLTTNFGGEQSVFDETIHTIQNRVSTNSPVLTPARFKLFKDGLSGLQPVEFELQYPSEGDLEQALDALCDEVEQAVRNGARLVILTDRYLRKRRQPIHAALAVGAVHQHLISTGLRVESNLVVDTGFVRDPHQCAVMLGLGATAVHPYLAYHAVIDLARQTLDEAEEADVNQACLNYQAAINKGLLKILSKMGISTIGSYRGARLFEVVGLSTSVVRKSFKGMKSNIEGLGFAELHGEQLERSTAAWLTQTGPSAGGRYKYVHGGEYHCFNPDVVTNLRLAARTGDPAYYQAFADAVNQRGVATLRDLLVIKSDRKPIALDEVEAGSEIIKRFDSAAMSLGALSPEAHEALAEAMNRMGARSNSGEGGEDPARYGGDCNSAIKQVASGRFGVTPAYLRSAQVLQIKIAQGAKPGEGGQLPGGKVNRLIARLRYSMPGVALISPPPHHDIYSIEDLAQLIFDLKQVNPGALVSVKLVSEPGIGTIASGVAKAYADLITVSGYDGGTAASPLSSIHNAGSPWELGLSETHQALRVNGLRGRVRVQADGGLKTGLDVLKAALLGAESFGFGTAPMIAMGCKYLRICHLNNCATGVATQDKRLREHHFVGTADMVVNYFTFVVEEVRSLLAGLGYASLGELIGRNDLLRQREVEHPKHQGIRLDRLLHADPDLADQPRACQVAHNHPQDRAELARQMLHDTMHVIEKKTGGVFSYSAKNSDRSIGAMLSGEIARRHGNTGMQDKPLHIRLQGTAGQSFGAWNAGGLQMHLVGEANDYVGKGMAGGRLVITPPRQQAQKSWPLVGNTCLYGATGGELFVAGTAGERFAVRNSGARAVVQGVGDHCCEYMTGGVVVVLGPTGLNFGAGMTGGFAFVYDPERTFTDRINKELIEIERMRYSQTRDHSYFLQQLLTQYHQVTRCFIAEQLLAEYALEKFNFWLVRPKASDLDSLIDNLRADAA